MRLLFSHLRGGHQTEEQEAEENSKINYSKLVKQALPCLWPQGLLLQLRVVLCVCALAISRMANIAIPLIYKRAVDLLAEFTKEGTQRSFFPTSFSSIPPFTRQVSSYIVAYVALKSYMGLQSDLRNLIFTPVAQHTRERIQLAVLGHLHALSHRYHLTRKTGATIHVRGALPCVG